MDAKVFNMWSASGAQLVDEGLKKYVTLTPQLRTKTGARYGGKRFHKSKTFIIERLINKIMVPGHIGKRSSHTITSGHVTGKTGNARKIVVEAFEIIEKKLKKNPVEVFVTALENASPREEIITIEYGGARYPKAVDCAPQRRVDLSLRQIVVGATTRSFNKKKKMSTALSDEIIAAYNLSGDSKALSKKQELERQADSSR